MRQLSRQTGVCWLNLDTLSDVRLVNIPLKKVLYNRPCADDASKHCSSDRFSFEMTFSFSLRFHYTPIRWHHLSIKTSVYSGEVWVKSV